MWIFGNYPICSVLSRKIRFTDDKQTDKAFGQTSHRKMIKQLLGMSVACHKSEEILLVWIN